MSQTKDVGGLAHLATYAYEIPLLGVKSVTEPNQLSTSYEYDTFGRIKNIKNTDNQIVKSFKYNFVSSSSGSDGPDNPIGCPFFPFILNQALLNAPNRLTQQACGYIELKPGFDAKQGSVYQAMVSQQ